MRADRHLPASSLSLILGARIEERKRRKKDNRGEEKVGERKSDEIQGMCPLPVHNPTGRLTPDMLICIDFVGKTGEYVEINESSCRRD
ncbi:Hypothetical predicted protein [Xyrichtys novacula]|uniref:Uncharacterized protein n=1 Tax=Xyrichtys novacula TaxID=13765 RepID=A0AAV1FR05_XYRNO|nr:Hypothetical predicted protein [Xyrichtys novacula]